MTRVEELIAFLQTQDPKAPVMLWDDRANNGGYYDLTDIRRIDPEEARIQKLHKHTVMLG